MNRQTVPAGAGDGTVGKALDVLDAVAGFGRPVRFAELLDRSPFPKATLYRLLQTLTNQGMLSYDEAAQTYAPGLRLVRLAHAAWAQSSLAPIARPFLDALSERVGETIHLAQLDQGQVIYVDKRNAQKPIQMYSAAGKVGPGYCTGVGKTMMAFLPEAERGTAVRQQSFFAHTPNTLTSPEALEAELARIRHDGIGFDREEHEPGIICVAAPILTSAGRVIGALSITTSTQRNTLDGLARLRPALTETANRIAEAAKDWQFPA
ncbi:IclR family transcriptional regulator [Thalassococcus sp. CAU 1522]|uniref:IclR family transcriptional regulator n=1 Tax=Thalassococcus arenae TaxID=2851652 RepID=A0ABS6N2V9_9RHOB|nr:IclR family transcriptional regulator [Thalassococcus arenae]MBV2358349.1 IclR family transcriptional regulator [Thalassococcus arenae]